MVGPDGKLYAHGATTCLVFDAAVAERPATQALQSALPLPNPPMSPPAADTRIHSYHAHVYFDSADARERAAALRQRIGERFVVQLGRWHDVPVGPHVLPMYQVAFTPEVFARFVPLLMLERDGLSVLVHPNTLAPRADHLQHALWLGTALPLKDEVLPERIDAADESPIVPNTAPRT